jgi:hypothetical protein
MNSYFALTLLALCLSVTGMTEENKNSGNFKLARNVDASEFIATLTDYDRLAHEYEKNSIDDDVYVCEGWDSFTQINQDKVTICTLAKKLGYTARIYGRMTAQILNLTNCQSSLAYRLEVLSKTNPKLLRENVEYLEIHFCLCRDNRTVSYEYKIGQGIDKSMIYPFIEREFTGLVPTLIKTVQKMTL